MRVYGSIDGRLIEPGVRHIPDRYVRHISGVIPNVLSKTPLTNKGQSPICRKAK